MLRLSLSAVAGKGGIAVPRRSLTNSAVAKVGFEQFSSSSKQGEYDCGAPKQRGVSKIKLTGNLNYHWDDGIPSLRQTIKQFFIRGLHESRNNMALHLC